MADENMKFTREHEWMREENGIAVCGISDHAQKMLSDIVYVELPEIGARLEAGGRAAVVESVKAVSDVFSPVNGEVIEVNAALEDSPELLNSDPEGEGWIFKVKSEGEAPGLMDAKEYAQFIAAEE